MAKVIGFVSPHPDDVPLSCGGLVHQLVETGHEVCHITMMAGDPPQPLPNSPLIAEIHQRWGLGDNPYPLRRDEDKQAIAVLGATALFNEWLDCIYRTNAQHEALYISDDDLFGKIKPDDPLASVSISDEIFSDMDELYLPIGAGNHVDHLLVRDKFIDWYQHRDDDIKLNFYEEYPYSSDGGEVYHAHTGKEERLSGNQAIDTALRSLPVAVISEIIDLSEKQLDAKVNAVLCYQSQVSTFWENAEIMAQRLQENAHIVGQSADVNLAERIWRVQ